MFMISKKGSVLILIGIGLLLALVGPSDALKCYECRGTNCDNPSTKDCNSGIVNCAHGTEPINGTDTTSKPVPKRECGESEKKSACKTYDTVPGYIKCYCDMDLCNKGDYEGASNGSSSESNTQNSSGSKDNNKDSGAMSTKAPFLCPVFVLGVILFSAPSR